MNVKYDFYYRDETHAGKYIACDEMKANLIASLDEYSEANTNYLVYGSHRGGRAVGFIRKGFDIASVYSLDPLSFVISDAFCLQQLGAGFIFSREKANSADHATAELDVIIEAIHAAIYTYDELHLTAAVDAGELTEEELVEVRARLYDKTVAEVKAFVAESDRIYHELGEKYFARYYVANTK